MGYSVTKAAGLHLMKCLASTQGPKIRVNAILPGLLLTEWVSMLNAATLPIRTLIILKPMMLLFQHQNLAPLLSTMQVRSR